MTTTTNRFYLIRSLAIALVVISGLFGVAFVGAQEADTTKDASEKAPEVTPRGGGGGGRDVDGTPLDNPAGGKEEEGGLTPDAVGPLTVSCEGAPDPAGTNRPVTWTSAVTGGNGTYTYSWAGNGSFPDNQTGATVSASYTGAGEKNARVTVVSGNQTVTSEVCSIQVVQCDRVHDLSGEIIESVVNGKVTATIRNDSTACSYDVGLASYKKITFGLPRDGGIQELFDQDMRVGNNQIRPGQTLTLSVDVPSCSFQTDLFTGPYPSASGAYTDPIYHLFYAYHDNSRGLCQPTNQCPVKPQITSADSRSGRVGVSFSHTVTTTGGVAPVSITITPVTTGAPGLSINGATISGIPTQTGTFLYAVQALSAGSGPGCAVPQTLTIVIDDGIDQCPLSTLQITSPLNTSAMLGTLFVYNVTTVGGVPPILITIDALNPAPGLTISGSKILGTPTTPGTYTYTITAQDANSPESCAKVETLTITVGQSNQCPAKPEFTSSETAPQGRIGSLYSFTVTTQGGVAPVSITITPVTTGAPGLSINGATISGVPTQAGTFKYNVRAISANSAPSCAVPQTLTLTIVGGPGPECIPPTNLAPSGALPADTTSVTLSWTPVQGAISYNIRLDDGTADRYDDPRFKTCLNGASPHYYCEDFVTVTSVANVPVKPGHTYSFWVDPNFAPGRNYCSASVKFNIPSTTPVPICTLTANPNSIEPGQSATLTWTSSNVTTAVIDHGVGSVAVNGSTTVSPSETTTYKGTFSGQYGTVTCQDTITLKTSGDDDDDDDDDDDNGGGGGGSRRRPNVVLFSEPEVLGTSISLAQIPYTGLGTSIAQIILFILGLLAISGGIIYTIMRRVRLVPTSSVTVNAGSNRTTVSVADETIDEPALAAYEEYAYAAPVAPAPRPAVQFASAPAQTRFDSPRSEAGAPANIPVAVLVSEAPLSAQAGHAPMNTLPSVQKTGEVQPTANVSTARIQNEARASRTLISDDGAELLAYSAEGDEKKALERLGQIVEIAKSRYPREDGWLILDKDRVRETLFISTLSMIPLFIEWIVRGEDKKVFTFLRMLKHQEQPVADFMRKVVSDLDNAYRARMEGSDERANVNQHIAEVTYHLSNKELETIVGELLHGVDERYDSAYTSVRLSLVRVLDIIKERSLRAVGSTYAFADSPRSEAGEASR